MNWLDFEGRKVKLKVTAMSTILLSLLREGHIQWRLSYLPLATNAPGTIF